MSLAFSSLFCFFAFSYPFLFSLSFPFSLFSFFSLFPFSSFLLFSSLSSSSSFFSFPFLSFLFFSFLSSDPITRPTTASSVTSIGFPTYGESDQLAQGIRNEGECEFKVKEPKEGTATRCLDSRTSLSGQYLRVQPKSNAQVRLKMPTVSSLNLPRCLLFED